MTDNKINMRNAINSDRRKLLQGAACVGVASFAPAVFATSLSNDTTANISGKLICKIYSPTKTLMLRNHSNQTIVIDRLSQGAFMYDGNIVDCNAACVSSPITIPPNQEIEVKFDKQQQFAQTHRIEELRRVQARVTRLHDGTRVIPFTAQLRNNVAVIA